MENIYKELNQELWFSFIKKLNGNKIEAVRLYRTNVQIIAIEDYRLLELIDELLSRNVEQIQFKVKIKSLYADNSAFIFNNPNSRHYAKELLEIRYQEDNSKIKNCNFSILFNSKLNTNTFSY